MAGRLLDRTRIVIALAVAAAIALSVVAIRAARTGEDAVPPITDPAVQRVFPRQGDLVLGQSQVGIDLTTGYRGVLIIDGQELPTVDLVAGDPAAGNEPSLSLDAQFDPAQNTIVYTPRPKAPIAQLDAGEHTVTAVFWKMDETRDQAHSYTWHFNVS